MIMIRMWRIEITSSFHITRCYEHDMPDYLCTALFGNVLIVYHFPETLGVTMASLFASARVLLSTNVQL